jgi:hypothetical protein
VASQVNIYYNEVLVGEDGEQYFFQIPRLHA